MSRIRTIKPELFKHEELFDAEIESHLPLRLAFIGLFTAADCEGRFRWKPRTLKLDVLPHDAVDFSAVLDALEHYGFIQRYQVDGNTYGWIPSFKRHQRIQTKEAEAGSAIPAPPDFSVRNGDEPGTHPDTYQYEPGTHPESQERKGKEREEEGKGMDIEIPSSTPLRAVGRAPTRARAHEGGDDRSLKKAPIPPDWQPSESALAILAGCGIYYDFAMSCVPEFILYWTERGERRAGWDASFVNSARRSWEKYGKNHKVLGRRRPGQTIAERITEEHDLLYGNEPDPFSFLPHPAESSQLIEGEVEHVH